MSEDLVHELQDELEHMAHAAPSALETVPVRITEPIPVQRIPGHTATGRTYTLNATTMVQILTADRRRSRALVNIIGAGAIWLAFTAEVDPTQDTGHMYQHDEASAIELKSNAAVWVCAVTGSVTVSVLVERLKDAA